MSCKSALYTAMQTPTAVAVGGVIPLGGLIRRYGCDIALNGNAVNLSGVGYYDVDASITATLTAAGAVTATLYKDGVAVPGATATETGAASGTATVKKASSGEARRVAATSMGRSPMASKALCRGCTMKGRE